MSINSKTVIVTGGAGYVGSHTCKALALNGYTPVTVDNLTNGHKEAVRWGPFERVDVLDAAGLEEVFKKYKPSAVLHFAAFAYVEESVKDPKKYELNNITGSKTLLQVMQLNNCHKFIFSSTCAIYGIPTQVPIREEHPLNPINPYGETKKVVEKELSKLDKENKIKFISLRYFNAAGSDPDLEIGEDHHPETHVIPLCLQAAKNKTKFIINGSDYSTDDGTCVRDYTHVTDLAQGHVKALEYLASKNRSEIFNLGTGHGYSVNQIVKTAEKVTGQKISIEYGPRREGDPTILVADSTKARNILQWSPQYSDLESQIQHAWAWLQKK
jgi:UDP-arabinose 4-epimerase